MLMTIKFPLKMSERAFVCRLRLLNIDTYSNILIESSINTNEMFSRVNEKRIYVIDKTFGVNESIFSANEQQKVYSEGASFFPSRVFYPHDSKLRKLQKLLITSELCCKHTREPLSFQSGALACLRREKS